LVSWHQKSKTIQDFNEARDNGDWVAVASAGAYENHLHLAPYRTPCQHLITQLFTDWMLFLMPNQQCQSTQGNVMPPSAKTK